MIFLKGQQQVAKTANGPFQHVVTKLPHDDEPEEDQIYESIEASHPMQHQSIRSRDVNNAMNVATFKQHNTIQHQRFPSLSDQTHFRKPAHCEVVKQPAMIPPTGPKNRIGKGTAIIGTPTTTPRLASKLKEAPQAKRAVNTSVSAPPSRSNSRGRSTTRKASITKNTPEAKPARKPRVNGSQLRRRVQGKLRRERKLSQRSDHRAWESAPRPEGTSALKGTNNTSTLDQRSDRRARESALEPEDPGAKGAHKLVQMSPVSTSDRDGIQIRDVDG